MIKKQPNFICLMIGRKRRMSKFANNLQFCLFQAAAMHQAMAAGHLSSSLVPNAVSHGGYSPGQIGSHGGRSPVSSPTPQPPPLSAPSGHMGYSSGQITPGGTQSSLNTSGNDGGMSSDCSDDEGSPGGGGGHMPQIYPWMKKIHVAGAGGLCKFCKIQFSKKQKHN